VVKSFTSRTRKRQMVAPKRYNCGVLVCYALAESEKFFKKTENISGFEKVMVQVMRLPQTLMLIGGKWIFKRTYMITPGSQEGYGKTCETT
jgi:hypothetical protein